MMADGRGATSNAEKNGSPGDKGSGNRTGHEAGQSGGQKSAKTETAEVLEPVGSDRSDSADKDSEGRDMSKTAEGIRCNNR